MWWLPDIPDCMVYRGIGGVVVVVGEWECC